MWSEKAKSDAVANDGGAQQVDVTPQEVRDKCKAAWETPTRRLIDAAADRGARVCQSQSLSLWSLRPNDVDDYCKRRWRWSASDSLPVHFSEGYALKTQTAPPACPARPARPGAKEGGCCASCGGDGGSGAKDDEGDSVVKEDEKSERGSPLGDARGKALDVGGDSLKSGGSGASRARESLQLAGQSAPRVAFIDEVDALGRRRSDDDSSSSERDQALSELLACLDGFKGSPLGRSVDRRREARPRAQESLRLEASASTAARPLAAPRATSSWRRALGLPLQSGAREARRREERERVDGRRRFALHASSLGGRALLPPLDAAGEPVVVDDA